jgi:hypothetical protein
MPAWLRSLVTRRDNLLNLVSVCVVVLILLLDTMGNVLPNGAIFEAILVVLGLISVSQIVERELRFREVRVDLAEIKQDVSRLAEPRFYKASQLTSVVEFMQLGEELFYSGGHLHSLLHNNSNYFRQWLRDGKSLRFLLQDPDNEGLRYLEMPCVNYAPKVYVEQIRDSIEILSRLKSDVPAARLGVSPLPGKIDCRKARIWRNQYASAADANSGTRNMDFRVRPATAT